MRQVTMFFDYECPFCKRGYAYFKDALKDYDDVEVIYRPIEAHPRPENHPPHTDLSCQTFYIVKELGGDILALHEIMYQAVATERQNVEDPEVLADIVKGLVDRKAFLEILNSDKYRATIDKNNDDAYEHLGVWAVPAFREGDKKLDAKEGIGVSEAQVREFLKV